MIQFDEHIFQRGLKPSIRNVAYCCWKIRWIWKISHYLQGSIHPIPMVVWNLKPSTSYGGPDDFNGYGYFYVRLYWTGFGLPANIVEELSCVSGGFLYRFNPGGLNTGCNGENSLINMEEWINNMEGWINLDHIFDGILGLIQNISICDMVIIQ